MGPTILTVALERYLQQLNKKPLRTKAITAATLSATSDIIAQWLTSQPRWNWRRTLAVALYGFCYTGPAGHFWQQFVERFLGSKKDTATLLKKVLLDSVSFGPLANLMAMVFFSRLIEGKSWEATNVKLQRDYPLVQLNAWRVWPLVSLINYRYIPLHLRVPFHNVVALFWGIFLIMKSASGVKRLAD